MKALWMCAVLLATGLAGCGDGDDDPAPTTTTTPPPTTTTTPPPTTTTTTTTTTTPPPTNQTNTTGPPPVFRRDPVTWDVDVKSGTFEVRGKPGQNTITVQRNDFIRFTSVAFARHTVTGSGFDLHPNCTQATVGDMAVDCLDQGESVAQRFRTIRVDGEIVYCKIHGEASGQGMTLRVFVQDRYDETP